VLIPEIIPLAAKKAPPTFIAVAPNLSKELSTFFTFFLASLSPMNFAQYHIFEWLVHIEFYIFPHKHPFWF
jgi:hypothetical protein